jgi:hypothetical protein
MIWILNPCFVVGAQEGNGAHRNSREKLYGPNNISMSYLVYVLSCSQDRVDFANELHANGQGSLSD